VRFTWLTVLGLKTSPWSNTHWGGVAGNSLTAVAQTGAMFPTNSIRVKTTPPNQRMTSPPDLN